MNVKSYFNLGFAEEKRKKKFSVLGRKNYYITSADRKLMKG